VAAVALDLDLDEEQKLREMQEFFSDGRAPSRRERKRLAAARAAAAAAAAALRAPQPYIGAIGHHHQDDQEGLQQQVPQQQVLQQQGHQGEQRQDEHQEHQGRQDEVQDDQQDFQHQELGDFAAILGDVPANNQDLAIYELNDEDMELVNELLQDQDMVAVMTYTPFEVEHMVGILYAENQLQVAAVEDGQEINLPEPADAAQADAPGVDAAQMEAQADALDADAAQMEAHADALDADAAQMEAHADAQMEAHADAQMNVQSDAMEADAAQMEAQADAMEADAAQMEAQADAAVQIEAQGVDGGDPFVFRGVNLRHVRLEDWPLYAIRQVTEEGVARWERAWYANHPGNADYDGYAARLRSMPNCYGRELNVQRAEDGFYYSQRELICYYCQLRLHGRRSEFHITSIHCKYSSRCERLNLIYSPAYIQYLATQDFAGDTDVDVIAAVDNAYNTFGM
jgi:hypothetical protein